MASSLSAHQLVNSAQGAAEQGRRNFREVGRCHQGAQANAHARQQPSHQQRLVAAGGGQEEVANDKGRSRRDQCAGGKEKGAKRKTRDVSWKQLDSS